MAEMYHNQHNYIALEVTNSTDYRLFQVNTSINLEGDFRRLGKVVSRFKN